MAVWAEVKDVEMALGNGAVSSDDYCTIIKDCAVVLPLVLPLVQVRHRHSWLFYMGRSLSEPVNS